MTRTVSPSPEQSGELERIWLIYDKQADEPITWADNPNPYVEYGEQPDAAIEYVRADALESAQAEIARLTAALRPYLKQEEAINAARRQMRAELAEERAAREAENG